MPPSTVRPAALNAECDSDVYPGFSQESACVCVRGVEHFDARAHMFSVQKWCSVRVFEVRFDLRLSDKNNLVFGVQYLRGKGELCACDIQQALY